MVTGHDEVMWRATGASVRGADHIRRDAPNQDAVGWSFVDEGSGTVLAVADGHGSPSCFRSDAGSDIAVAVARRVLSSVVSGELSPEQASVRIVADWQQAVMDHVAGEPFRDEETQLAWGRPASQDEDAESVWLAYGTTVLAAGASGTTVTLLQLGDGDILVTMPDGTAERPMPTDERLVANQTTSLASKNAADDFRISVVDVSVRGTTLVMLCSDGYTNSFESEEGFLSAAPDYMAVIRKDGLSEVETKLESWLWEHSELGSGDDVTVGLMVGPLRT